MWPFLRQWPRLSLLAVMEFPLSRSVAYLVLNALDFDQTRYALIFSVVTCLTLDSNTTSTVGLGDLIPR